LTTTVDANNSSGFKVTADTSGILQLQTNGTAAVTVDASQNVCIGTGSVLTSGKISLQADLSAANAMTLRDSGTTYGISSYYTLYQNSAGSTVGGIGHTAVTSLGINAITDLQFSTANTERMRLDSSGNLGLGVTPSAWAGGDTIFQIKSGTSYASLWGRNGSLRAIANAYYDGTNYKYASSSYAPASFQVENTGSFSWNTAPTGTAGNNVTFTQAMTLDNSGNLILAGTTASSWTSNGSLTLGGSGGSYGVTIYNGTNTGGLYFASSLSGGGRHAGSITYNGTSNAMLFETNANGTVATIDSSGNLGIGTTSPSYKLDVSSTNSIVGQFYRSSTSSGILIGANSGGAIVAPTGVDAVQFFNAAQTTVNAKIDSSGNLLVAKTSTSDSVVGGLLAANGAVTSVRSESTNAVLSYVLYSTGASNYRFYVGMGGTVYATSTTITSISDLRLKENIRDLDEGLTTVMALQPRKFDWKEGKGANIKNARGFIAQEFEQVLPDMIEEWRDPAPEGEEPYKAINANLIPTLVKAIQEQQALITQLQADVAALKGA